MKLKNTISVMVSTAVLLASCGGGGSSATTLSSTDRDDLEEVSLNTRTSTDNEDDNDDIRNNQSHDDGSDDDSTVSNDSNPSNPNNSTMPTAGSIVTAGRLLAAQCAQCHGTDGISETDIDSLAGESRDEIIEEMSEMKNETDNEVMHLQAKGYSAEEIGYIADYFASLPKQQDGDD